jgi:hypothetical protein
MWCNDAEDVALLFKNCGLEYIVLMIRIKQYIYNAIPNSTYALDVDLMNSE